MQFTFGRHGVEPTDARTQFGHLAGEVGTIRQVGRRFLCDMLGTGIKDFAQFRLEIELGDRGFHLAHRHALARRQRKGWTSIWSAALRMSSSAASG